MDAHPRVELTSISPHAHGRLVRAACWLGVAARVILVMALLSTLLVLVDYGVWERWYVIQLSACLIVWVTYIAFILGLRCPGCRGRFLLESWWRPRHPGARRIGAFDYHGTAVVDVIRYRRITCMYCGRLWEVG